MYKNKRLIKNMQILENIHKEQILEIQLNLNEKNLFNPESFEILKNLLQKYKTNTELKVVLFSSGRKGYFSSGLDPQIMIGKDKGTIQKQVELIFNTAREFLFFPLPVISVISGHCTAAGAVFALFSDYRFMNESSGRIGFPEVHAGLNFPTFVALILKDVTNLAVTRDLLLQGKLVKATEAKQIGLVDEIYPEPELFSKSLKFAEKFLPFTNDSLKKIKISMREGYRKQVDELLHSDIDLFVETILSKNGQEGFRSILENRRPKFK
jgi:enoyl-CoA hydratase/carnithine racemase